MDTGTITGTTGTAGERDSRVEADELLMPAGFSAGGSAAGIKTSGRPDLAVISVTGAARASAAATFTSNRVAAAPVRLSRAHLARTGGGSGAAGYARGVIVSSGCANAATGADGDADQERVARLLAESLRCSPEETLLASTGLIGTRLPLERIEAGLARLVPDELTGDVSGLLRAARAILTTDSKVKTASATIAVGTEDGETRTVTISGIAKGVGMIHPRMATMIAVLLTDAAVAPETLAPLLADAVDATFNQLTVDGDTSTNDTVFLLASGASGSREIPPGSRESAQFRDALTAVCRSLARQQAADGEGATALISCHVSGGAELADARAVARSVVASSLVKTAVHGRDPNWGRVAAAAGAARRPDGTPVALEQDRLTIALAGTHVFRGTPLVFDAGAVRAAMSGPEVVIELDLGLGTATAEAWGCDLTEKYVRENSEYST